MKGGLTEKIQIMVDPAMIRRIDDWRFANRVSSRSLAMRSLIEAALEQSKSTKTGTEEAA